MSPCPRHNSLLEMRHRIPKSQLHVAQRPAKQTACACLITTNSHKDGHRRGPRGITWTGLAPVSPRELNPPRERGDDSVLALDWPCTDLFSGYRTGPAPVRAKFMNPRNWGLGTTPGPLQIDPPFDTIPKGQKISIFRRTDAHFVKNFQFFIDFLGF